VDVDRQTCESVAVCAWRMPFAAVQPAQVVIEAFGCALPESYLTAMSLQVPPPVWINLEYLSAEPWVAEHHGLPSPHPRLPLTKYFFFPGYTAGTGGLLAEADLAGRRAAFVRTGAGAFWRRLGLGAPQPEELRVSLFAYENPALPALLDAWAADTRPVTCLVPEGRVIPQLTAWLTVSGLQAGDEHRRGALRLRILPFLDQDTYDCLLWACGLNFVRARIPACGHSGQRVHWSGKPIRRPGRRTGPSWMRCWHVTRQGWMLRRRGRWRICGSAGTASPIRRIWRNAGRRIGRSRTRSSVMHAPGPSGSPRPDA